MKSIIKLMVVFVCVVSLVACGRKDTTVSANKDGVLYEAGVGVSFYYPSDFELSEGNPNDGVTRFTKENQILFYKVEENKCYEYKGSYVKTGLKFIHLVYFDDKNTYVYGYEANRKDFRKNLKKMIVYLESFTKSSGL